MSDVVELGATRDDAAGEAFDKVAKLLGLGYPGGPIIDRLAKEGDPNAIALPKPMPRRDSFEFSFSGLKTTIARWVEKNGRPRDDATLRNLCASFQKTVVDTLVQKAVRAARKQHVDTLVLGGGVAANSELRRTATEVGERYGIRVVIPPFKCCTDNAAMIAFAGSRRLEAGEDHRTEITAAAKTELLRFSRKGPGRRPHDPVHGG
jgi:N6-L-threonylcarbamoyladenine synthase